MTKASHWISCPFCGGPHHGPPCRCPAFTRRPGKPHPLRIVATRKDESAMKQADSRLSPAASNGERLRPRRGKWHSTLFWKTNLPDTAGRVLELYRARWQIEYVFHRLKGLFSFGGRWEPIRTPSGHGAMPSCSWPRCAKLSRGRRFFPPTDCLPSLLENRCVWRELTVALRVGSSHLLVARAAVDRACALATVPVFCRRSKRKRLPTIVRLYAVYVGAGGAVPPAPA